MNSKRSVIQDFAIVNDKLYYISDRELYYVEIDSWKPHYVKEMWGDNWIKTHWVAYMESIDDVIFLFGRYDMCIAMYDTEKKEIKQVYEELGKEASSQELVRWDDKLFFFPKDGDSIYIIDKQGYVKKLANPLYKYKQKQFITVSVSGRVYFFQKDNEQYWICDLNELEWESAAIPFDLKKCICAGCYDNSIFFIEEDTLTRWIPGLSPEIIRLSGLKFLPELYGFIVPAKEKSFLLPKIGNEIYEIANNGEVRLYNNYPEDFCYIRDEKWQKKYIKYYKSGFKDGVYYYAIRATNYMLTIDVVNERINWVHIDDPSIRELAECVKTHGGIMRERFNRDLEDFISMLAEKKM